MCLSVENIPLFLNKKITDGAHVSMKVNPRDQKYGQLDLNIIYRDLKVTVKKKKPNPTTFNQNLELNCLDDGPQSMQSRKHHMGGKYEHTTLKRTTFKT